MSDPVDIEVIREHVAFDHLKVLAETGFGNFVKAVVDVGKEIMAVGGELHADEEAVLLDQGSVQANLWGINLYPAEHGTDDWIEFDSMINVRPRQNKRSRYVEDPETRQRIAGIVEQLVSGDD